MSKQYQNITSGGLKLDVRGLLTPAALLLAASGFRITVRPLAISTPETAASFLPPTDAGVAAAGLLDNPPPTPTPLVLERLAAAAATAAGDGFSAGLDESVSRLIGLITPT